MNSIVVSQATIEDIEGVATLFNEYRIFYKQKSDIDSGKVFLLERIKYKDSVILIAKKTAPQEAVGFVQLYPSFSSVSMRRLWILNDLYVREEHRGQGVAQMLLDAAKNHSKQTEAKGLILATAVDNVAAQKLYEKNGYVKDTEFFHYYLNI